MIELLEANFLTVVIIIGSIMVTPFYVLSTYVFSGASEQKGLKIGFAFMIWGSLMFWVCLNQVPAQLGIGGNLIVPLAWILPSLILYWQRQWFFGQELSQRWLMGLQMFRVIGCVF